MEIYLDVEITGFKPLDMHVLDFFYLMKEKAADKLTPLKKEIEENNLVLVLKVRKDSIGFVSNCIDTGLSKKVSIILSDFDYGKIIKQISNTASN